eukprot:352865-Chlamydomonas_euryale.AAC.7
MPSRAKLIPGQGSGSSGGTSSTGNSTLHVPSRFPARGSRRRGLVNDGRWQNPTRSATPRRC